MSNMIISPSILSSDFSNLNSVIAEFDRCKVDSIHLDVMDGHFVPNITFGPVVISAMRKLTKTQFETHLMIKDPNSYIKSFVDAGSDLLIIHYESDGNLSETIGTIRSFGKKVGIAINPKTPFESVREHMIDADLLLVMSVEPGFAGQLFMPQSLEKVRQARDYIDREGYKTLIGIDGGINLKIGKEAVDAGVDQIIAASAITSSKDVFKTIQDFKNLSRD
jgi:ribulose-phosphate 3-epimerase